MKLSNNAMTVLTKRYLRRGSGGDVEERPIEMFRRVARNISMAELRYTDDEEERRRWEDRFFDVMSRLDFLPNSPTLMNAGTAIQQLAACFVLPVDDSMESIFDSVKNAALIHKSGGGTGFSFSRLRPKDDFVQSTKGVSSGPVSFMAVFDAATEAVKQGGRRRGANMAILRVDHPDIIDFVEAKRASDRLSNFNISVALTEDFMHAVEEDEEYDLVNPRHQTVERRARAREVFEGIVSSAWRNGEPGIVFIDRINRDNPTPLLGNIESTNPCGEQPLLPYESCNLGSINLAQVVRSDNGRPAIDYGRLGENIQTAVRFLDNVIDMNEYPLVAIAEMTRANRKIGLGVMGFADMLIRLGVPYDSEKAVGVAEEVMEFIRGEARSTSRDLAEERGAFPNYKGSIYDVPGEGPIRNATTTTVAPTGTISIIANVSSGIEPVFAIAYVRNVLDKEKLVEVHPLFEELARREGFYSEELMKQIARWGSVQDIEEVPKRWRAVFKTSHDITPEDHLRIQAAFQKYTDNAVSKTVNFSKDATAGDVERVFRLAFELGCKGVTIYRDGSREEQVLSFGPSTSGGEGATGIDVLKKPRARSEVLTGETRRLPTGCGNLYVTINNEDEGAFELFAQIGKAGGCAASQAEAIGRLVSLALRAKVDPAAIAKQLRGVRCPSPAWHNGKLVLSCADGISKAMESYLMERQPRTNDMAIEDQSHANRCAGLCPDCSMPLEFDGGCAVCRLCGFSRCG